MEYEPVICCLQSMPSLSVISLSHPIYPTIFIPFLDFTNVKCPYFHRTFDPDYSPCPHIEYSVVKDAGVKALAKVIMRVRLGNKSELV